MLKTSNNIYLAFTYLEGSTLAELIEAGPKSLTLTQSTTRYMQRKALLNNCA